MANVKTSKNKNKLNFLSKINFKSPKTRGLILLAAFVIIGGGVMVFRSFAATTNRIVSVSVAEGRLKCSSNCALTDAGGSKGNVKAASLSGGGVLSSTVSYYASKSTLVRTYTACVTATGSGTVTVSTEGIGSSSAAITFNNGGNSYETKCANTNGVNFSGAWKITANQGSLLKVTMLTVDETNNAPSTTTPVVTPTCTKNCGGKG
ncbi:hypothetical protein KDA11_01645 [Candidatus Saccharibacteria bacterium]|nr:hypothetical protein [Candidatus Saccharibacteria bacterium]